MKSGVYKDVRHRKKNKKLEESDVIIIDKNAQAELGLHPKLLQFHENVRPPYWGTWRKKSKNIRPKNPFGQDVRKHFICYFKVYHLKSGLKILTNDCN